MTTDLDKQVQTAYDKYMMAVRTGVREEIENAKAIFDLLTDERNQKNFGKSGKSK